MENFACTSQKRTAKRQPQAARESAALVVNSLRSGEAWKEFAGIFLAPVSVLRPTKRTQNSPRKRGVCVDYSQLNPLLMWVSIVVLLSADLIYLDHGFTVLVYITLQ